MKKKMPCLIALALVLALAAQPAALAGDFYPQPELPDSLRNFVDETTQTVNISGTEVDIENVVFLEDRAVGEEFESCVGEVPEDAVVMPVGELPPALRTELRREPVREHEESLALRNAEKGDDEEPEATRCLGVAEDPNPDREAAYLYLVGRPAETGSYLFFVYAGGTLYLCSQDVLSELPDGEPDTVAIASWPSEDEPGASGDANGDTGWSNAPDAWADTPAITAIPAGDESPLAPEPPVVTEPPVAPQPPVTPEPPVVTEPPEVPLTVYVSGQTECRTGDEVKLNANVSGRKGRVSYQWYYTLGPYSAPVAGANSSGLKVDTSRAGVWNYFCLVTDSAGRQAISDPLTLTVVERQASSISIESMPSKTSYYDGQSIDPAGLLLLVRYDDGTVGHVSEGFTFSPETAVYSGVGTQRVRVSYRGASVTYTISVRSMWDAVSGIAVVSVPNKTSYRVGDTLDTTGLVLRIFNVDGGYIDMDRNFTCSPTRLTEAGSQVITVRFGDKWTRTFTVDVREAPPTPTPTPRPTAAPASAGKQRNWQSGDYEYAVLYNGTAQITKYTGNAAGLAIPERLDGYAVTAIGDGAFSNCENLTSVTIPDRVTTVGVNPFQNCKNLKSIYVSPDHTALATIRGVLFSKADKRLISYPRALPASTYAIPQGIKSIGGRAFSGCENLRSVTIPSSVVSIGDCAFYCCGGLRSVTIPGSVASIGDYVFYRCTGLRSVTIPGSVASIGDYAFYRCEGLTSVTIPDGVASIGYRAFSGGTGLSSVTIPGSVVSVGDWAFSGCEGLSSVTISDGVASIGKAAFQDCGPQLVITVGRSSRAREYCRQNGLNYIYPDSNDWLNN